MAIFYGPRVSPLVTWNGATTTPNAIDYTGLRVTPIHTGMRRCVMNDAGVVQYYLDPLDSTKKANGTASVLTGADGQVMVEIPKFYTKRTVDGNLTTWSISSGALPGFSVHPAFIKDGVEVNYRYVGAYQACVFDVSAGTYISGLNWDNNSGVGNGVAVDVTANTGDKLASVSGVHTMGGLTRAEFRTLARNRGSGWRLMDFTIWSAIQLLYLIEHQTFDSQSVLGAGNCGTTYAAAASGVQSDNGGSVAGKSNSLGNRSTDTVSGASSTSRGVAYMSYRGLENIYGNQWCLVDGVIVNPGSTVSANSARWWFTNNSSNFSDSTSTNMTLITTSAQTTFNWIQSWVPVDNFFISSTAGGSSSTYVTDYWYGQTSSDRIVYVGGSAEDGFVVGMFANSATSNSGTRYRSIAARLAF